MFGLSGYYTVSLSETQFKDYINTIDSNHITKLFNGNYINSSEVSMVAFNTDSAYIMSYIKTSGWYEIETSKQYCQQNRWCFCNTSYLGLHFEIELMWQL